MRGGNSNKPIVFVFGAEKGDADGRKKNLSAINTQVAYRAHERRREKKSRQRAQAKADGKVDQSSPSTAIAQQPYLDHLGGSTFDQADNSPIHPQQPVEFATPSVQNISPRGSAASAGALRLGNVQLLERQKRLRNARRESDLSSDSSSDHDAIWSNSPSSHAHSSPTTDLTDRSPLAPVQLSSYFDTALDPFFRLPTRASEREKWLVHFYFREMGHIGFGTHSNSLFCPDRDWVSTYVSTKSICFQWILIHAEQHLSRIGVLPDQSNTLERKARAYGQLQSVLKSQSVSRDEGISGIMYAAILDVPQTNMHLMALDRFIGDTGGFDAFLDGPLGIAHPEHVATVFAFGQCPIRTVESLTRSKAVFLDTLQRLYDGAKKEQEEKRRIRNRRPWDSLGYQELDSNGVLVPANHDEHFRYYIKAQQDCFSSFCLSPLLNTTLDYKAYYPNQARHVACLAQILMILNEFDDNYLARAMFLKRLKYVAEMSTSRDPITGQARLSHAGLLLINSYVRQEVQTHVDRTKMLLKGVRVSKVVVDFLKIFPLLQTGTRSLVVSWLRDWLCYNDLLDESTFGHLTNERKAVMAAEITNSWLADRTNEGA